MSLNNHDTRMEEPYDKRTRFRPRVVLATCEAIPAGEPGHEALSKALEDRNIEVVWCVWNDHNKEIWKQADLVLLRSTWDYIDHLDEFLQWATTLEGKLVHSLPIIRWNMDKRYLLELKQHEIPIVPSENAEDLATLKQHISRPGRWVVKPAVGAAGVGVEEAGGESWKPSSKGPWLIQPFIESVEDEGEISIYAVDGNITAQFVKRPKRGEIRVHQEYGGRTDPIPVTEEAKDSATAVIKAAETIIGLETRYARVDLLRYHGQLVVAELELLEPRLYLDIMPEHNEPFADMVVRLLK